MDNRTKTIAAAVVALTMAASYTFPAGTGDIDPRFGNAVVASAADAWNGKIDTGFAGGDGTAADPYQIATGAQLAYFAEQINSGYPANTYFKLTDDIDLGGKPWTPIGNTGGAFNGNFDGGGHTVSGVSVSVSDHYENAGFFGFSVGVIKNLAVKGNISGVSAVGGICGGNSGIEGHGTISNCSFEGTVTGTGNNVGGICGYNFANSKISSCFSSAAVKGAGEVGGICGYNDVGASVGSSVSAGTVSGSSLVGSVCGKNDGSLSDNYFDSSVSSAVGAKDGSGNEVTSGVTGLTTSDLCNNSLPTGLDSNVWKAGKISPVTDPNNARMRTLTAVYPSLANIGEAHKAAGIKQYNFGIDSNEDWAEYTEINSAADLKKIGIDGSYVLMKDITLGNFTPLFGDNEWFDGRFSGNGHTISGVNISTTAEETGIFSVNNGIIMNLAVKGNISGGTNAGGICGTNGGTIYGCSFEGSVNGRKKVGGISGHNTSRISNCYVIGTIKASADSAGGIGGYSESSATIGNCYFAGTVTAPDSGEKDAICSNQTANVTNCCYNKDLYTEASSGTGLTTFEMTSGDALNKMNLGTGIWTKQANNVVDSKGQNGVAYYPSIKGSTSVPSVKYTADITFERADKTALAFLDWLYFKYDGKIEFKNGSTVTLNNINCFLTIVDDKNAEFIDSGFILNNASFGARVSRAGKITYTFTCKPLTETEAFLPSGGLTKSFSINAAKKALTANDFKFKAPTGLTYDGTAKQATVRVTDDSNQGLSLWEGYGDITVKYFDSNGKQAEPINAGEYTVKIDVSEGENCLAAKDLTADTWKFTIAPSQTTPTASDGSVTVSWAASGKKTVDAPGLPPHLGDAAASASISGDGVVQSAEYSDGKIILTMAQNKEADVGKADVITFNITSPNFTGTLTYKLTVTLSAKTDQAAPDANDVRLVFTSTESGITAKIATALTGVEYSFDGVKWSSNTASVDCEKNITAYIRFAETEDKNASPEISVSGRTGHAALIRHDKDDSVCVQGDISEYWECSGCGKYFSDENGTSELDLAVHHTVDASAEWESDNDKEHYHICTVCHGRTDVAAHTFDDGVVTLEPTETAVGEKLFTCTVCGYEKREVLGMTEHVHSVGDELYSDETGHWKSCLNCGERIDFEEHTSDNGTVEGQARVFRCTVCGYEISRVPIPNENEGYRPPHFDGSSFGDIFSAPMPQFKEKLKAKSEANGSTAVISWDKAEDAEKYVIYLLQDGKYKKIMTTKDTSVSVDKLKNGQTYRFMVRYIKNGELSPVTYSSKITVNIYYKPIVTAKAAENSVSLSWKAVPGAEKYAIYKYTNGKAVKLAEVKSTSVRIDGLKPDTEYSCIVSAFVDGKWTVMTRSDIVTVTTNK